MVGKVVRVNSLHEYLSWGVGYGADARLFTDKGYSIPGNVESIAGLIVDCFHSVSSSASMTIGTWQEGEGYRPSHKGRQKDINLAVPFKPPDSP